MERRSFLKLAGAASLGFVAADPRCDRAASKPTPTRGAGREARRPEQSDPVTLFLCGDVMTGRGIDQVLPHSVDPKLYEPWVRSALDYVALAERANGAISRPVEVGYVWGDALDVLDAAAPSARIINLETAVTSNGEPWPHKGIHYRMHPKNVDCLTAAGRPCCVLANNHVLDWGRTGLADTLAALRDAGLPTAGAGRDFENASAPAVLPLDGGGRVLVFGLGHDSSGILGTWAAARSRSGVNFVDRLSARSLARFAAEVRGVKRPGDVVVASIHWGDNWGYSVPRDQRSFARGLIDEAGVDLVHGHSSHHPKGVEVHRDRLILYGCGDFINDYEGIRGYEEFRGDLTLMYLPRLEPTSGRLLSLGMVPMRIRRFRLERAPSADARWLAETLGRESAPFGCRIALDAEGSLVLHRAS